MHKVKWWVFLSIFCSYSAFPDINDTIKVTQAYIDMGKGNELSAEVYGIIINKSQRPIYLTSASTTISSSAKLITTVERGGVEMPIETITIMIPPHSSLELAEDKSFISLRGLRSSIKATSLVKIRLNFDVTESIDVDLPIVDLSADEEDSSVEKEPLSQKQQ